MTECVKQKGRVSSSENIVVVMRPRVRMSIHHAYRITLTLLITEKEIILLDIGSYDEVYR